MSQYANVERLEIFMDLEELDGLIIRSAENFSYLTGVIYPGTLGRHLDLIGSIRSPVLIWPRKGPPEIVLNDFALEYTRLVSDINITTYLGYRERPYDKVSERINALGLKRVGLEFQTCTKGDYDILRTKTKAKFVEAGDLMDRTRWSKTPQEIALIKKAADLLDEAYLEVLPTIRPGDRERDVHGRMMESCISKGFGFVHGILNSHRNEVMYNGESDFVIEAGDMIRTDYVAYLDGYPGHQSRNVFIGQPSSEILETYKKLREVYGNLMQSIRPNVEVGFLYKSVLEACSQRGLSYSSLLIGHSVGPWFHQQEPIIRMGSKLRLENNMVLALEPYIGSFHIQDLVLVTPTGCELLSDKIDTEPAWIV